MTNHNKTLVVWSATLVLVGWAHSASASAGFDLMADPVAPQTSSHTPSPADGGTTGDSQPDHYGELRVAIGAGATNSAHSQDDPNGSQGDVLAGVTASMLGRRGWLVLGATGSLEGELFGARHTFLGFVTGVAVPGETAHFELLSEIGAHMMSSIGDGFLTTTSGETSAELPYVGAQARISIDPGVVKHLAFDVAVTGRFDLARSENRIHVDQGFCMDDCESRLEIWDVGGQSVDVSLGLRYLF